MACHNHTHTCLGVSTLYNMRTIEQTFNVSLKHAKSSLVGSNCVSSVVRSKSVWRAVSFRCHWQLIVDVCLGYGRRVVVTVMVSCRSGGTIRMWFSLKVTPCSHAIRLCPSWPFVLPRRASRIIKLKTVASVVHGFVTITEMTTYSLRWLRIHLGSESFCEQLQYDWRRIKAYWDFYYIDK